MIRLGTRRSALATAQATHVADSLRDDLRQQAGQPVRLQPQPQLQLVAGEGLEVVGAIEPGGGVEGAARLLD